jgi:FkbM family methyltransferase
MRAKLPNGFRVFFWVSAVFTLVCAAGWHFAVRALDDPRYYDPHLISEVRGQSYPFTVEVFGYTYKGKTGDYIDDHILAYGAYEKDVLFFMGDYVEARGNPDAVFLDVGACEGQHSLFMSRRVKQVHAFEPFPPAIDRFNGLIKLNGFTNIAVHEVGLGDKEGVVPFFAPEEDNVGSGTFLAAHKQGEDKQVGSFRVVTGDSVLGPLNLPSVDVIKIDVEGFEGPVLRGLAKTLERYRPVLVIEVTHPPKGTIKSLDDLWRLMPGGYEFLRFQNTRGQAISGNYRLDPMTALERWSLYEMVVAYPREQGKFVRRERHADSKPTPSRSVARQ